MNEPETTETVKRKPGRPRKLTQDEQDIATIESRKHEETVPLDTPTTEEPAYLESPQAFDIALPVIPPPTSNYEPPPAIERNAVVQVFNTEDPFYGVLFTVGDVRKDQVHGFYVVPGEEKRFVTTTIENVRLVGKAFVGSRNPCSPDWVAQEQTA